ncbi:MAG: hypothetical protein WC627_12015 [Legionella sp.]|jgi:hypothetical protein
MKTTHNNLLPISYYLKTRQGGFKFDDNGWCYVFITGRKPLKYAGIRLKKSRKIKASRYSAINHVTSIFAANCQANYKRFAANCAK